MFTLLLLLLELLQGVRHLSLLASRSDSSNVKMSPSLTGPLTLRMIDRLVSSKNSTRTCVHCPWDPVRPKTLVTFASLGLSIVFECCVHLISVTICSLIFFICPH